jgi:hypothetical protein
MSKINNTPEYHETVLQYPKLISEYENRYPEAPGSEKHLLGTLSSRYRKYLVDLEAGLHYIDLSGRGGAVCLCGLRVPNLGINEEFPDLVTTPGHLDINQQPTNIFFYFKPLAPQYSVLYLVCQDCKVIEQVEQKEREAFDRGPTHDCTTRKQTFAVITKKKTGEDNA